MKLDDGLTLEQVAQRLKKPEDDIKKATEDVLKKQAIMLSKEDIEVLKTHFGERDERNASRRKISPSKTQGNGRRTGNRTSGIVVEQRKTRGARKARSETPESPVVETPETPAPEVKAPIATPKVIASASSQRVAKQRNQENETIDKIFDRNVRAKPTAKQPELVEHPKEALLPAEADIKLQPIGTIRIDKGTFDKRVRKQRHRHAARNEPRRQEFVQPVERKSFTVDIPETIPVKELAYRISVKTSAINDMLVELDDKLVEIPEEIDQELACLIVEELGHTPVRVYEDKEAEFITDSRKAKGKKVEVRPPVVTVMGHVDHGKTSLLDFIRKTKVTDSESGGITQHIGAYQVSTPAGDKITFIDTPGHEVFTEMRMRGAKTTDIVVLVVAADDGVQPQTKEAVSHAQAAKVPIVVAINKIDLPNANLDNINQQLMSIGLQSEQWGGQTLMVPVSALTGEGIDKLLEAILLTAEVLELEASLDVDAHGSVIEVRTEKGLGPSRFGHCSRGGAEERAIFAMRYRVWPGACAA